MSNVVSPVVNPFDNEELYNQIELGDRESPGKVTLTGHDRNINWDIKDGSAQSGATTTIKNVPPAEFTATFQLVKDVAQGIDDFEEWDDFAELIRSTVANATPKALDIYHPDLAANDIKSVVLKKMGGMIHDGKGGATVAVVFLEYKPPKKKGGSPSGSKAKSAADPNAAALAELAALTKQYQNTPWG